MYIIKLKELPHLTQQPYTYIHVIKSDGSVPGCLADCLAGGALCRILFLVPWILFPVLCIRAEWGKAQCPGYRETSFDNKKNERS